ncbi:hypothetical protein VTK26DRAFT_5906 [Humicola hyalothermophila]
MQVQSNSVACLKKQYHARLQLQLAAAQRNIEKPSIPAPCPISSRTVGCRQPSLVQGQDRHGTFDWVPLPDTLGRFKSP